MVEKREREPITDTPEFKTALDAAVSAALPAAVEAAVAKLSDELRALRQTAGTEDAADAPGDTKWLRQLAMAIAEVSDQGTNRKRVAPEILAKREAARQRMGRLILEARAQSLEPEYRLIGQVYLAEEKLDPFYSDPATKRILPRDIVWTGPPNEAMRPLNDTAFGIFEAFMESIGGNSDNADWRPKRGDVSGKAPVNLNGAWVTERGLYIKGASAAQRRTVGSLPDSNTPAPQDTLIARRHNDPTAAEVRVLGSVHPPARQNYQGEPRQ